LFPALAGLIGFLGVFGLFDNVLDVLFGVAPLGVIGFVSVLRARLLLRGESGAAQLEVDHARITPRQRLVAGVVRPVPALRHVRRALLEDVRNARDRRILLLWLNYSAFALLFGAEPNSELDRQADIRAAGGPDAGLVTPARRSRSR
jgi:hypothetical protein